VTSPSRAAHADAPGRSVRALRGNCMGAAVLLIIEFTIGIGVNLYVTVPQTKSFMPKVFSSAALGGHAVIALLLLGAAIGALIRAIRARRAIVLTAAGLASAVAAHVCPVAIC